MLPRIILHNAVSIDGRIDGFTPDIGLFYELAGRWQEDATLVGSETILAAPEAMASLETGDGAERQADSEDKRALLVVPDSRGRIRDWPALRHTPYWRDVVVLCSKTTPEEYLQFLRDLKVDHIIAGEDHVDFPDALAELTMRYDIKVVRADSGGTLNGILLRAGLVDEVSLLISPCLVGSATARSMFRSPQAGSPEDAIPLKLMHAETLRDDAVWLRYKVVR